MVYARVNNVEERRHAVREVERAGAAHSLDLLDFEDASLE
jgi:hypothetical protein